MGKVRDLIMRVFLVNQVGWTVEIKHCDTKKILVFQPEFATRDLALEFLQTALNDLED
jgi:hypothetical protein